MIVEGGGARPPILVLAMGGAFGLLVIALLIGSLTRPEFPPYALTAPHPARTGDSLVGPATYTVDAAATDHWRRFDFGRNAAVDSGPWDLAFRRFHVIAAPGGGIVDLGAVPFDGDGWGVDVAIGGSQKALMATPGLGFVSVTEKAKTAIGRSF